MEETVHRREIIVNGEAQPFTPGQTLADLVTSLGLGGRRIAIEVNEDLVPRSRFDAHALKPGDRVEIVHAIGGG
ncbi:sulfur carrier protein ThiS [Arhodomonas sp. AD133]|uniref:sulfur carrier protein ThiS n=1 Tax=Arhodomonas sp. AD133 TaxID=3415009 RepID=UPI003EBCF76A